MKPGEIAHSVSRGAFYLGLEKVVSLLSGVLYFALVLRWMGPVGYGLITLALSCAGLATIATGNIEVFLERYAAEYQARGSLRTLRRAMWLALLIKTALGLVGGAALVLGAPLIARELGAPQIEPLLRVLSLVVVFDGFHVTGRAALYGMQEFRGLAAVAAAFHVAKAVMVGSLWGLHQGLPELAMGLTLVTVAQGLALTALPAWLLRHGRDEGPAPAPGNGALVRAMVGYATPLMGARAAFLASQHLSKIVLGKLLDPRHVGYFAFAFQTIERFVELAHTLPNALLPSLTRLVARQERERLSSIFDQAFRLIGVAASVLAVGLFVFAPEVTRWVGSAMFLPAVPLLRVMALVPLARTAQQPLTMLFQALRRPGTVLRLALVKFGVEFAGYFTLVPALGLIGAGVANLAGAIASYVAALVLLARILPEGARTRAATALRVPMVVFPVLILALVFERALPGAPGLVARLALIPAGVAAIFALGLVTRYDLQKLSSLPLGGGWRGRVRDSAVAAADRLARALPPRRA